MTAAARDHRQGGDRLAARAWRLLTSMSFAVAMLFIVAVAAVIGSLVDQNQPYAVYVNNFGSLWADFYRLVGVDDIYHASWFLLLLGALALSTALCVWQKAPLMLRELRSYKEGYAYEQVRRIQPQVELQRAGGDAATAEARVRSVLQAHGFRLHAAASRSSLALTGRKGLARRIGYLLTHGAIVVICIGGLVDGNVPLKWKLAAGSVVAETRSVAAEQVGAASRLGPGTGSFRGALQLRPGEAKASALLTAGDGFLLRELPFQVRLKEFRIDYHDSGQPRDFVSEIDLLSRDGDALLRTLRLSVNHPAEYEGVQFFQSGFDDGGTRLDVSLLGGDGGVTGKTRLTVGDAMPLLVDGTPMRLEPTAFRLKNVIAQAQGERALMQAFLQRPGKGRHSDLGPSVEITVRDAAGQPRTQTTYVNPITLEGRPFFVVETGAAADGQRRVLRFPLDAGGSLTSYHRVISGLREIAGGARRGPLRNSVLGEDDMPEVARRALPLIATVFLANGFRGLSPAGTADGPDSDAARDVKVELLMRAAVLGFLRQDGAEAPADALRLAADSLLAYSDWLELDRPPVVKVDAAEPLTSTVLQVSYAPGRVGVYAGMACLALGVILLVLVPERRVWVRSAPSGDRMVLALAAHSPSPNVATELERMAADLAPEWTPSARSTG